MRPRRAEPRHVPVARLLGNRTAARLLLLVVGILVVLGLAGSFGYRALRDSSLFAVHAVVVSGADPALSAQVQAAVHDDVGGRSLLALSSSKLAHEIEIVPGVRVARVDRDFPSTLRVTVWPEHAVALAVHGHDRVVVSATGRVLRRIDNNAKPPNLPRVPLRGGVPRPGTQIQSPEVLAQLRAVDAIPRGFGARIAWSKLDPDHGLELQLNWPKLWIRLGPAVDLRQKLRAAALVLRAYPTVVTRQNLSYVDVSAPARPAVMPLTPDQATVALAQAATDATTAAGSTSSTGSGQSTQSTGSTGASQSTTTAAAPASSTSTNDSTTTSPSTNP
jgi:cell division septal protein FtsQ